METPYIFAFWRVVVSVGIHSANSDYEVQIYTNLTSDNPLSGTAMIDSPIKLSTDVAGFTRLNYLPKLQKLFEFR